jgi:hypothetical protein
MPNSGAKRLIIQSPCMASLTFNSSTFFPHSVFMCFVWIWEQTVIISLYSNEWLVFITKTERVTARYGLHLRVIYINLSKPSGQYMYQQFIFNSSTSYPHCVFMCFVWIWEQTAIISVHNINWLILIIKTGCVYCAVQVELVGVLVICVCAAFCIVCAVFLYSFVYYINFYLFCLY